MRMLIFFFAGAFTAFAAFAVYSAFKYTRMISGIFLSLVYKPVLENFSSSLGEKVTILDSSDHEIEALWLESRASRKVLIFCHESGAGKESWEKYAYFVPALGFHLLSIDFQKPEGREVNSLSQWPTREDVDRLVTSVRWAKSTLGKDVEVVLFGISNGADIALRASFEDPSVRGVVTDGLFSMKEIFRDYIRKWAPILVKPNLFGEKYPDWIVNIFTDLGFWYSQKKSGTLFVDVEQLLGRLHLPLLMIHGENDDYVPAAHQAFLEKKNAAKGPLERLVVAKARHNESVVLAKDVYQEKISKFLKKI